MYCNHIRLVLPYFVYFSVGCSVLCADLHALADRLARACRLESIDKYCTLPRQRHTGDLRLSSSSAGWLAEDQSIGYTSMLWSPINLAPILFSI